MVQPQQLQAFNNEAQIVDQCNNIKQEEVTKRNEHDDEMEEHFKKLKKQCTDDAELHKRIFGDDDDSDTEEDETNNNVALENKSTQNECNLNESDKENEEDFEVVNAEDDEVVQKNSEERNESKEEFHEVVLMTGENEVLTCQKDW